MVAAADRPAPVPSSIEFEWNVERDIEQLDSGHDSPTGAWSDGTLLWLAENGDGADDAVYAYDLATGERVEEREFELARDEPRAARPLVQRQDRLGRRQRPGPPLRLRPRKRRTRRGARDRVAARQPRGPRHLVGRRDDVGAGRPRRRALRLRPQASGELIVEYALHDDNDDPRGLWSDGVTLWVSNHDPKRIFAYRIPVPDAETTTGEDEEAAPLERVRDEEFTELSRASNNSPRGIWSDGEVMYVADESDGRVYSYNLPDAIDARLASLTLSGVDFGEFDPGRTEYEGVADEGVTETTVAAEAAQRGATRLYRAGRMPNQASRGPPAGDRGRPRGDHGHRDLGGREPHEGLPRALRPGASGRTRPGLPARRRRHRLQPPGLRGGQRRGTGGLRAEQAHHGRLRPCRRRVRLLHPRGAGVREPILPRAVHRRRAFAHATDRRERRAAHSGPGRRQRRLA